MKKKKTAKHPPPHPSPTKTLDTLGAWLAYTTQQIESTEVNLENGMQEPYLEAEYLLQHALSLTISNKDHRKKSATKPIAWQKHLRQRPPPTFPAVFLEILHKRLQKRLPAAYITGEAFFGGYRFAVNPNVLIPRSRIENLLDSPKELALLLGRKHLKSILDLGTGSGCLAIAFALAFPEARVDASDISVEALRVAAKNRRRFKLEKRLQLIHSNLFDNLKGKQYTLIVANPPYVNQASMATLPAEYCHEPAVALEGGMDGLALVEPILRQSAQHLTPKGMLICEVGDETEGTMKKRWPDLPVEWIHFHFGASGVFAARCTDLAQWAEATR